MLDSYKADLNLLVSLLTPRCIFLGSHGHEYLDYLVSLFTILFSLVNPGCQKFYFSSVISNKPKAKQDTKGDVGFIFARQEKLFSGFLAKHSLCTDQGKKDHGNTTIQLSFEQPGPA